MRASVESKSTGKTYNLIVQHPGDRIINDWHSFIQGDEPVISIMDAEYKHFHRMPPKDLDANEPIKDEDYLGYFLLSVPISEFEDLPQDRHGNTLLHALGHDWEMDTAAMDEAAEIVRDWSFELGLNSMEMR